MSIHAVQCSVTFQNSINWLIKSQWIVLLQKVQNNPSLVIKAVFNYCNLQLVWSFIWKHFFSKIFQQPLNTRKTWNIERSSAFQLFGAIGDSSVVDNINIAPQRSMKCFDNLVKKFDFNLIISNPEGSSDVKLGVCTRKQEPKDSRNTS